MATAGTMAVLLPLTVHYSYIRQQSQFYLFVAVPASLMERADATLTRVRAASHYDSSCRRPRLGLSTLSDPYSTSPSLDAMLAVAACSYITCACDALTAEASTGQHLLQLPFKLPNASTAF